MSLTDSALRVVLYEGRDSEQFESTARYDMIRALLERGFPVSRSVAESASPLSPSDGSAMIVLGRFANRRAPEAEDAQGSIALRFADVTDRTPDQVAEIVETVRTETSSARHGTWKPWFPVIDYDRCTNCMQCLSFCLFGVYGVDAEKQIQVQNQDNCKTNCPACSRVCPEAAIMFPKYKAGPINGDLVSDADLQREKMKVDISALLGGDVYSLLRQRSEKAKSRFSKERDADKALAERQKCLTKLAQMGDIPAEVLMSLPSPDEIARRAEEAAAKAKAALGQS